MGFFWRSRKKRSKLDKLIAGIVIGGAIGSIVGKKLIEKRREEEKEDDDEEEGEVIEEDDEE